MSKNQRNYDNTEIRKLIKEKEAELYRLYRQETKESGEGEIQTKTAKINGKRVKFDVNMWTEDFEYNGETDVYHVTQDNQYSYRQAVFEDCIDYYCDNLEDEEWERLLSGDESDAEAIADTHFDIMRDADDSVTGSASGSYFCNTFRAKVALFCNEDLWEEACSAYDGRADASPEDKDCLIRCYLCDQYYRSALIRVQEALKAHKEHKKIEGVNA